MALRRLQSFGLTQAELRSALRESGSHGRSGQDYSEGKERGIEKNG